MIAHCDACAVLVPNALLRMGDACNVCGRRVVEVVAVTINGKLQTVPIVVVPKGGE